MEYALEASAVDPRDSSCSTFHFLIHVLGAPRTIAPTAIPQADEAYFIYATDQRSIEQPQIAAFEGVHAFGKRAEFVGHDAREILQAGLERVETIAPLVATGRR